MECDFRQRIAGIADRAIAEFVLQAGYDRVAIPEEMGFRAWCEDLARRGLKVDGKPFTLDDRPAMHFIYDLIPGTLEEARGKTVVMMKCAQVGFTVMEMLAAIYMLLKFEPCTIGMFLPDAALAGVKSSVRFLPILRLVPDAYARLTEEDPVTGRRRPGEGNVRTRQIGESLILFLWTTGKATTESMPMDILSYDEVQEMRLSDMEKANERMSASRIRFRLMGSTARWPDKDIHWWYKRGTQHRFHTRCAACGGEQVMDDHFPPRQGNPGCMAYDEAEREWRYACVHCRAPIDPQNGEWRPDQPEPLKPADRGIVSVHFPQFLSPTISAREMMEAYQNVTDLQNFYNRKLGKPWNDPSQVPVTLEHLRACVAAGEAAGLTWKSSGRNTFMGIDNMGGFCCVLILERMPNGAPSLIHAEQVHALDPWARLDELMRAYGVGVAVCEQLPNYDSAKQFASRWPGRVFLVASYGNLEDDMIRWGDAVLSRADRKTGEAHRDRYTVTLDQYKMMSWSFARIVAGDLRMPDPNQLQQEIIDGKGVARMVALLRDVIWDHFMRTALVTLPDEEEHKMRRFVKKIGLDPHFSFALMLACAAWCRANGTGSFLMPELGAEPSSRAAAVEAAMPGLPSHVVAMIDQASPGTCGGCAAFSDGQCTERGFGVGGRDTACMLYVPAGG